MATIGRVVRRRSEFLLMLAALTWGVASEAVRPGRWRRTVRAEFRRTLAEAAGGGLLTAVVTAALTGLAMVAETLYWLGVAGQRQLAGPILVTLLVREITPLLIGLLLLGRSGMVAVAEVGALQRGGQTRALAAQGIDPFLLLVLPRALALALASFTLGVVFALTALVVGFISGSLLGAVPGSLWSFLDRVLAAMQVADFAVFPAKMLVIGLIVALTACLTGMGARPDEDPAKLLPLGFVRGLIAIMVASLVLSLAA
ncbi:MAG: MlaE family ABC transporter permease [Acetobacteraceae bacterium]